MQILAIWTAIFLYADDVILLAPSVCALQSLVAICASELEFLDMAINVIKAACMRFGPRYSSAISYTELLTKCLKQYCEVDYTSIIVGDFNIPTIDWGDLTHCTDYISTLFAGFARTGGFTQFVNFHTRDRPLRIY